LGVAASHLELFSAWQDQAVIASNGRSHAWSGAYLEMDLVLSGGANQAFEQRVHRQARRLDDLVPDSVLEAAARAVSERDQAVLPPTGQYAVVFPAEAFAALLSAIQMRASAEALFQRFFSHKVGDRLIASRGDAINIRANPLRPFAVASNATDASTVPASPIQLLEDGVLVGITADPQYGAYLEAPATGPVGTLEWTPGHVPAADLVRDGRVLEVFAFSSLLPNAITGDFAAEIKSGWLHEPGGRRTPVSQGGESGNVLEYLADCLLSRETEEHPGYFGPARVRVPQAQVSGA
jgi:predicted Zn-dependent protease